MMFILFSIDNHTIAVVNMPEKYYLLEAALDPLLSEIKELLALKMGFAQANSKYSCIWCLVPSSDWYG